MFVGDWTATADSVQTRPDNGCGRDYRLKNVVLVEVSACAFPGFCARHRDVKHAGQGSGVAETPSIPATVGHMRIAIVVLGVFVALFGLLFTLQGFGAVSGSPMSNTTTWSILGPIIALIGIALAFAGWRGWKS